MLQGRTGPSMTGAPFKNSDFEYPWKFCASDITNDDLPGGKHDQIFPTVSDTIEKKLLTHDSDVFFKVRLCIPFSSA